MRTNRLRRFLDRSARTLTASVCLLAVSMQLALPVLHQVHGGHEARIHTGEAPGGSIRAASLVDDHGTGHEPATCPQCRAASDRGWLGGATIAVASSGAGTGGRLVDPDGTFSPQCSGHEGPARAPPRTA